VPCCFSNGPQAMVTTPLRSKPWYLPCCVLSSWEMPSVCDWLLNRSFLDRSSRTKPCGLPSSLPLFCSFSWYTCPGCKTYSIPPRWVGISCRAFCWSPSGLFCLSNFISLSGEKEKTVTLNKKKYEKDFIRLHRCFAYLQRICAKRYRLSTSWR